MSPAAPSHPVSAANGLAIICPRSRAASNISRAHKQSLDRAFLRRVPEQERCR